MFRSTILIVLTCGLLVTTAATDDFDLSWWTIDSGGEMWTTEPNAQYELSGTIGQPDASVTMTGGDFELTGGFWALPAGGAPPILIGDLNCSGAFGFDDINPFVKYVSSCATWQTLYPDCPPENGDIDGDGQHACNGNPFDDINAFVRLLSGV